MVYAIASYLWQGLMLLIFFGLPLAVGKVSAHLVNAGVGWGLGFLFAGLWWGWVVYVCNTDTPLQLGLGPLFFCAILAMIGLMMIVRFA